ncbi:MAG: hypothetical protein ACJ780_28525 [Solirubrobacteraceae bacterium]
MTLLIVFLIVGGTAAGGYFAYRSWLHRRTPPELRGDWWTSFERDFRAYARSATRAPDNRDRHGPRHRGSTG